MKRLQIFVALALFLIIIVTSAAILVMNNPPAKNGANNQPFYVGVTYGGDTIEGAKQLIDKVKNYTNLFILTSGTLQQNLTAVDEIGDYTVATGLKFAANMGLTFGFLQAMESEDNWTDNTIQQQGAEWIKMAKQRWGNQFIGAYIHDEPGGKFLEETISIHPPNTNGSNIIKLNTGGIAVYNYTTAYYPVETIYYPNGTVKVTYQVEDRSKNGTLTITNSKTTFTEDTSPELIVNVPWPENWPEERYTEYPNGTIAYFNPPDPLSTTVTYYPSGDITVCESQGNIFYTATNGSERISQAEPLNAVLNKNPIRTYDEAAQIFEIHVAGYLRYLADQSVSVFTSDFVWYWWDYRSGYDVVLAELGWNNSVIQEIGLVRGAANLQNKQWGTILTWTYTHQPYLASGDVLYDQMRLSYECGADYVVLFNYALDTEAGDYGILQDEHFQALERFWFEVVENDNIVHGGIGAEAVLVLPINYGWGMRNPQDRIWGIWDANGTSQQIWNQVQNRLTQYGSKLDIVYDDPTYPAIHRYNYIHYWNQTD
ncbi:MAG: hypothetical protein LBQ98_06320 [Nitrososphaerota archaeon]|jgi:hypothetical protein|nr:hypothetical protein [Nitrososphaerota archaeon]